MTNMIEITKFYSDGCAKCKLLSRMLERLCSNIEAEKMHVVFRECNIDEEPKTAERNDVYSVPVIIAERDGTEVERIEGLVPEYVLREKLFNAIKGE